MDVTLIATGSIIGVMGIVFVANGFGEEKSKPKKKDLENQDDNSVNDTALDNLKVGESKSKDQYNENEEEEHLLDLNSAEAQPQPQSPQSKSAYEDIPSDYRVKNKQQLAAGIAMVSTGTFLLGRGLP
ncbi:hypothetical protein KGF54_002341 [Candida jiufengensis]|uniref:uncharacterized protein n=1 Tax=Candida jiufengensis TaxID=497108 RepID=UPI002223F137|nr:uncharacterized protein KGF54_002341 [Candida jiufengensis]KAI5954566.1 hypothetical protein KGF54_002341 [Candida jiufengensis]